MTGLMSAGQSVIKRFPRRIDTSSQRPDVLNPRRSNNPSRTRHYGIWLIDKVMNTQLNAEQAIVYILTIGRVQLSPFSRPFIFQACNRRSMLISSKTIPRSHYNMYTITQTHKNPKPQLSLLISTHILSILPTCPGVKF